MTFLATLTTLLLAPQPAPQKWYGPVTVSATFAHEGNPYDPVVNNVTADFVSEHGGHNRRLAYYIGDDKFAATLVAPAPGTYTATFYLNGQPVAKVPQAVDVESPLPHGFIELDGRHFAYTDGTPYFPIGYDYAWRSIPNESVADGMAKMGRSGANWSRIWADHWDNKNPFFPAPAGNGLPARPVAPGELRQDSLELWDGIVKAAEKAGIAFQFTLFHHGPYSTTTDSNWAEHPWNTKNGGFLADPTDFFINPEAKRRSKIWLRYAIARYGHSPAIMSWELFNEVQWVDAIKKHPERVGDVAAWHKEMAAYVKSLDPYHHLLTSSSSESLDSHVFDDVDYMQPHTYPANVLASIGGYEFKRKPGFFGEFGPPNGPAANRRKLVRDGIYGGILAGHAGAGMYWFWDNVDRENLADDFRAARKVIDQSGLTKHKAAKPINVIAATPAHSDFTVAPGLGWGQSTVSELHLPNVGVRELAGWSQYFQSLDGGQKGWAKPLLVTFNATSAGKVWVATGQVSPKGAHLTIWVNDRQAFDQKYEAPAAGAGRARGGAAIALDYPAGPVRIRIENHGGDWIQINSITAPGIGPTAFAHGLGDSRWALVRVFGADTSEVRLSTLGIADGNYRVTVFDAANPASITRQSAAVKAGMCSLRDLPADSVLDFSPG